MSVSVVGNPQEKVLVAIRTNAIRLEIPLASFDQDSEEIRPFGVTRQYLLNLIAIINEKFVENESRKQKLLRELQLLFSSQQIESPDESKEERRNRKRLEGLQVQAAKRQNQADALLRNTNARN
jgi:tRNA(Phe) wybutosine-synthesizing methylase Tyw3